MNQSKTDFLINEKHQPTLIWVLGLKKFTSIFCWENVDCLEIFPTENPAAPRTPAVENGIFNHFQQLGKNSLRITYQKVSERYNCQKVYAEMATNHKSFVRQEIRRHSSILDLFKGVYSNLDTADIAKLKTAKSSNASATSALLNEIVLKQCISPITKIDIAIVI